MSGVSTFRELVATHASADIDLATTRAADDRLPRGLQQTPWLSTICSSGPQQEPFTQLGWSASQHLLSHGVSRVVHPQAPSGPQLWISLPQQTP